MARTKNPIPRLDLNPSSADRWTTCTASPKFIMDNWDKVPEDTGSAYSREGTTAHEVAAAFLQDRDINPDNCEAPVDPDMLWHGWNYAEYVNSLLEDGKILVEQKLPLWYMPGRNAIVDAAVINRDSLHIVDYKYGEGVVVHPERSLQGTIYALCVIAKLEMAPEDDFPISIHIYQPRGRNSVDQPHHVWETTYCEVVSLAAEIENKAILIQQGDLFEQVRFAPSEKACQWCPARKFCVARKEDVSKWVAPLYPTPAGVITIDELSYVLQKKRELIRWLNDAEDYALEQLRSGNPIPGFKLVQSRGGNRTWSDPKKARKLLLKDTILEKKEVVEEKIISPAAVEKLLGKHGLSVELTNLITRPPGETTIAPEHDPREAVSLLDAKSEFEVLTQ